MVNIIQQLVLAALGSLGFALIFRVPTNKLVWAVIGGLVCWGGYLFGYNNLKFGILTASLFSTVLASFYAESIARLVSVPTPMIAVTAYIPLIPGKGLFYCMSNLVVRDWEIATEYGIQTVQCALGMALGMSIVSAFFEIRCKLIEKKKRE